MLKLLLAALTGYLFGSISCAVILTKLIAKQDVREHGSGNAGATNVARVYGMGAGALTFLADAAKTAASMYLGRFLAGDAGFLLAAAMCLVGHCYPVFFSFKGGKGVSVGAAIGLFIDWRLFALLVLVFFTAFLISKRVSVCSISCAVSFPIVQWILGMSADFIIFGIFVGASVVFMHRSNISRLIKGQEVPFKPHSSK